MEKRYVKDYEAAADGSFHYRGAYYKLKLDSQGKRKASLDCFVCAAVMMTLFFVSLCINNDGSRVFYILMPYIFCGLPLFYCLRGCDVFRKAGPAMERREYERGILRIKRSAAAAAVLTGYTAAADLLFLLVHRKEIGILQETVFWMVCMGIFLTALKAAFTGNKLKSETREEEGNGQNK